MSVVSDAYVINLDPSTDRMDRFKEANAHLGEIQRSSAVDGAKIDRLVLEREGIISLGLEYSPGSLGRALSHIGLWQAAVEQRRSITIFEDDAITVKDFAEQATRIVNSLGDQWDFICWGCHLNPSFAWIDLGVTRTRLHVYGAPRGNALEIGVAAAPIKLLHAFGAFAYSVSPSGAKAAIEYCLPLRHRLIAFPDADVIIENGSHDAALCGLYPSIKAFLVLPFIATTKPHDPATSDRRRIDRAALERENRTDGTVVNTTINGQRIHFFVTNPNDLIMSCHYQGAFYETEELDLIKRHYSQEGVFVDIGANIGNHTIYIARFTKSPRIIVFEPNPTAISVLKENLRLNQCNNVDTRFLGIALGAKKSRLRISTPNPNNIGWTYCTEDASGDIRAVDGDALILDEPIEFIKIDVEEMELEILSGLQRTIRHWRPSMIIEVGASNAQAFMDWCARESYAILERIQPYEGCNFWNYLTKPISNL